MTNLPVTSRAVQQKKKPMFMDRKALTPIKDEMGEGCNKIEP